MLSIGFKAKTIKSSHLLTASPRYCCRIGVTNSTVKPEHTHRQRFLHTTAQLYRDDQYFHHGPRVRRLKASPDPYLLLSFLACGGVCFAQTYWSRATSPEAKEQSGARDPQDASEPIGGLDFSKMPIQPGYLGNLTAEQETKLRELWAITLKTFGVEDHNRSNDVAATPDTASEVEVGDAKDDKKKKKRMSIFRRKGKDKDLDAVGAGAEDDKYGQVQEFHDIIENQTPESLRAAFWSMVKADHPDALLLRFLRARKWDVDKALVMLISTMKWRATEMHVDDDVMLRGEAGALEDSKSSNAASKKEGEDFLTQLRLGKSFLHGIDKDGRPLCIVRARLHKQGEQSEKSLERYTVYVIETTRLVLRSPVETACIIFDMSHFTMANMDYAPVKFMIKVFEANYPESLGAILVHKAPWIFQGIWTIIKGWLDPVVAGKVHFTKHIEDLQAFIPRSQITKELGGDEDWEYHYIEPRPGENDLMKDGESRTKLEQERKIDVLEYQQKTFDWIHAPGGTNNDGIRKERDHLAEKLNHNYWSLDPYIRARTQYDRQGMIQSGGKIDFYPSKNLTAPAATANGNPTSSQAPSADDVD